jgi:hypothetical protein
MPTHCSLPHAAAACSSVYLPIAVVHLLTSMLLLLLLLLPLLLLPLLLLPLLLLPPLLLLLLLLLSCSSRSSKQAGLSSKQAFSKHSKPSSLIQPLPRNSAPTASSPQCKVASCSAERPCVSKAIVLAPLAISSCMQSPLLCSAAVCSSVCLQVYSVEQLMTAQSVIPHVAV